MIERKETRDRSLTYYNSEFDETYHSMSGALQEAEMKHLGPAKNYFFDGCVVLDFCFGLGYNSIVALEYARAQNISISIVALENDSEIMSKIELLDLPEQYIWAKEFILKGISCGKYSENMFKDLTFSFELLLGDAAKTILDVGKESVSVVFFDPFSPKKCPHLWDKEVFKSVRDIMCESSILTTYSCARRTRENLLKNNFSVFDGPTVGRTSPGTIAKKY